MEAMGSNQRDIMEQQKLLNLPVGFRFHPSDEELVIYYLVQKVLDSCFTTIAIGEADLNKCEPWDLPWMAKFGEKEWYFFCMRDRKYPTGQRTNRATVAGYWKATGKDKEIHKGKALIGMKKTLVFYKGRAPQGEKTNWVMHEYRLESDEHPVLNLPKNVMNDWALCRVFRKKNSGRKVHIPEMVSFNSFGQDMPPLMDSSSYNSVMGDSSHSQATTGFSDPNHSVDQKAQDENIADSVNNIMFASKYASNNPSEISPASWTFAKPAAPMPHQSLQVGNPQGSDYYMLQDQSMLGMLIGNQGPSTGQGTQKAQDKDSLDADMPSAMFNNEMLQGSFANQEFPPASTGHAFDGSDFWGF
ncbi:hypothetical protein Fmac_016710 [Flemingia macrophylla]|uniref:NAC domain-containing protein n=1 Tax=Flemingia macrophylla TaxID=520843 RepID=A0ABD1MI82_9FABA